MQETSSTYLFIISYLKFKKHPWRIDPAPDAIYFGSFSGNSIGESINKYKWSTKRSTFPNASRKRIKQRKPHPKLYRYTLTHKNATKKNHS